MNLEEHLKLLNEALQLAEIGIIRYRMDGEIIFVNQPVVELFELDTIYSSTEEIIGKNIFDIQRYILPPKLIRKRLQKEESIRSFEYPLETLRGNKKWFLHYSYLVKNETFQEPFIQVILQDITELKETKNNLESTVNRFEAILNLDNKIAIQSFDKNYNVIVWNKYSEMLYGLQREDVKKIDDLTACYTNEQITILKQQLQLLFNGKTAESLFCWDIQTKSGEEKWVHLTLIPVIRNNTVDEVICVQIDNTEEQKQRKEREKFLAQTEHVRRLESIGILAGGIAHEFNNILMGIMGHAELALMYGEQLPKRVQDNLEQIRRATERAAKLTKQLLTYAGKEREIIQIFDFNDIANNAIELFCKSVPKNVRILQQIRPNLPLIEGDTAQIQQAITHILVNALEALKPDGGEIIIETGKKYLNETDLRQFKCSDRANPGEYAFISITDNGIGIKREDIERIFEPFFSTKFLGRGLGLASVSGVIRTHKGAIDIKSTEGGGSIFTLYFPAYTTQNIKTVTVKPTILVVDDEEELQKFFKIILQKENYNVICALNGYEAIDKVNAFHEQIKCIILDIKMPGIDGFETLRQIRQILPNVPVLVSTGYSEYNIDHLDAELKINDFLMKPFRAKDIIEKIKKII